MLSQITLELKNFNFSMASNKSLYATCDLDGYLFCKMPAGALEVEEKVKTTWGKSSMVQDMHTRMENIVHGKSLMEGAPSKPEEEGTSQDDHNADQGLHISN